MQIMGKGRHFKIPFFQQHQPTRLIFPKVVLFCLYLCIASPLIGSLNGYADLYYSNYFLYLSKSQTHIPLYCYISYSSLRSLNSHFSIIFGGTEGYAFLKHQNQPLTEAGHCVSHTWLDFIYMQPSTVMLLILPSCSDQRPN